jgi:hypothetical protein
MGYGHFPTGILILVHRLFGPFRRYRHGNDLREPRTVRSSLPSVFKGDFSLAAGLSDFLTFSLISPQLRGLEPFSLSFRHTSITHQRSLELSYLRVGKLRKE